MANAYFYGSTTKNAIEYKCGEEIVFDLTLIKDDKPLPCALFKWSCDTDDGNHFEGECDGKTGKLTFSVKLEKCGFAHVVVTPYDENGEKLCDCDVFEGGAGADIMDIEQGLPEPEDFDEFWVKTVKEIDGYSCEAYEKVQVESDNPNFYLYDVKIAAPGKTPASGYLSVPKNAKLGETPCRLVTQGYGHDSAVKSFVENTITLSLNQHGVLNGQPQEYYDNLRDNELSGFGFNAEENKSPETCYFKNMIQRAFQGAKFLQSMPEYDKKGLLLDAYSMGAMQAVSVAAHLDGISQLKIHIPWLCDLGGITKGRLRGWRPDISHGILYYDTVNQAKRVKCPVIIDCGLGDYICPPSTEVVLYKNFNTPKSITFLQNRTHPYTAPKYQSYSI